jgi:hypothetical protein
VTNFQVWLAHAAGSPTFSTQAGASGNTYPVMRILLTDGNNWNYVWPAVQGCVCSGHVVDWASVVWTPSWSGSGTFTGGGDDSTITAVAGSSAVANFSDLCVDTPYPMVATYTITAGGGFTIPNAGFFIDGVGIFSFVNVTGTVAGSQPFTLAAGPHSGFYGNNASFGTTSFRLQLSPAITPSPCSGVDYWQLYKIFNVPGYPGEWFGEWFNAVAWGNQLGRFTDSDLVTWLAAN